MESNTDLRPGYIGSSGFGPERTLTPGSPSKFLMAAFVQIFAQKVTAEICPVQPFVMQ
jgi:hypothetical protein